MQIEMIYKNWRGETSKRRVTPISLRYGTTDWHPLPGWLMLAYDEDKGAEREFALGDCNFLGVSDD